MWIHSRVDLGVLEIGGLRRRAVFEDRIQGTLAWIKLHKIFS